VSRIIAPADQLRHRLTELLDEDVEAYEGVLQARASTSGAAAALTRATEVPLLVARGSRDVLTLGEAVAPRARRSTLSDLGAAAALAWGALESAALTAGANLLEVADPEFARASERELAGLLAEGQAARHGISEVIARRMEQHS